MDCSLEDLVNFITFLNIPSPGEKKYDFSRILMTIEILLITQGYLGTLFNLGLTPMCVSCGCTWIHRPNLKGTSRITHIPRPPNPLKDTEIFLTSVAVHLSRNFVLHFSLLPLETGLPISMQIKTQTSKFKQSSTKKDSREEIWHEERPKTWRQWQRGWFETERDYQMTFAFVTI